MRLACWPGRCRAGRGLTGKEFDEGAPSRRELARVWSQGDSRQLACSLDRFSALDRYCLHAQATIPLTYRHSTWALWHSGFKPDPRYVVALAIVVGVALTPGIAFAGCGDHVLIINQSPDVAGVLHPAERGEKRPFTPCSGPDCSADPVSPGMPSGFPVSNPTELKSSAACDENVRDAMDDSSWGSTIRER